MEIESKQALMAFRLGPLVNRGGDSPTGTLDRGPGLLISRGDATKALELLQKGGEPTEFRGASKPGDKYAVVINLEGETPVTLETDLPVCTFGPNRRREKLQAFLAQFMERG